MSQNSLFEMWLKLEWSDLTQVATLLTSFQEAACFSQSLQADSGMVLHIRLQQVLSTIFLACCLKSPYHSTLYKVADSSVK
jgi:hypothetical protein